jgi:hypothetical protein
MSGDFADNGDFHANVWIFYMPQICDMGPTALLPLSLVTRSLEVLTTIFPDFLRNFRCHCCLNPFVVARLTKHLNKHRSYVTVWHDAAFTAVWVSEWCGWNR